MSNNVKTNVYLHRIEKILASKPWLLPFIVYLARNPMGTVSTISRVLGVKSSISKRALWWLSKAGIIELKNEGGKRSYQVREEAINALDDITRRIHYHNKNYLLRITNEYILVRVRRNRIIPYTIPIEIINSIERILKEAPEQEFTVNDLVLSMNIPARLIVQAIRILRILGVIEGREKGYKLKG